VCVLVCICVVVILLYISMCIFVSHDTMVCTLHVCTCKYVCMYTYICVHNINIYIYVPPHIAHDIYAHSKKEIQKYIYPCTYSLHDIYTQRACVFTHKHNAEDRLSSGSTRPLTSSMCVYAYNRSRDICTCRHTLAKPSGSTKLVMSLYVCVRF